jgi:hypothetical protein
MLSMVCRGSWSLSEKGQGNQLSSRPRKLKREYVRRSVGSKLHVDKKCGNIRANCYCTTDLWPTFTLSRWKYCCCFIYCSFLGNVQTTT